MVSSNVISMDVPESHVPAEVMGHKRGDVRLIVANRRSGKISSGTFGDLTGFMEDGDLLVVNNSSLINASFSAYFPGLDMYGDLNFGTSWNGGRVMVEPRPKSLNSMLHSGARVELPGAGIEVVLVERHGDFPRLWWAETGIDQGELGYMMSMYGKPIAYGHVPFRVPDEYYRTVFSSVPGSVELPSASLPFTDDSVRSLREKGVRVSEITLHCNIGSLEPEEFSGNDRLLDENYTIYRDTIEAVSRTRENGGRVIALGTTAVRTLESFYIGRSPEEIVYDFIGESYMGTTDLFIRPGFRFRVVDGLLTGMHDPSSSHIEMMSSFLGPEMLSATYGIAMDSGYLWHEFGDMTLIL